MIMQLKLFQLCMVDLLKSAKRFFSRLVGGKSKLDEQYLELLEAGIPVIRCYDVAVQADLYRRVVTVSFLTKLVPGMGLVLEIEHLIRNIPCLTVDKPLLQDAFNGNEINIFVPNTVELEDVARYLVLRYIDKKLAVKYICKEMPTSEEDPQSMLRG